MIDRAGGRRRSKHNERAAEILGNGDVVAPRGFRHQMDMEAAIQLGRPHFPHNGHVLASILTAGLWLPVYWLAWLFSARRRYQNERRRQLQAEGLL